MEYRAAAALNTKVSYWFLPDKVEALAIEEALAKVGDVSIFNKALVLHNGNKIDTTVSLQLGADVGVSSKEGVSVDAGIKFGYSTHVKDDTGKARGGLVCAGTASSKTPASVELSCRAECMFKGNNSATGYAIANQRIAMIAVVGTSSCPGAGNKSWGKLIASSFTPASDIESVEERATHFMETRTGRKVEWHPFEVERIDSDEE